MTANGEGVVAEIGPVYTLLWAGTDSVASIVNAHRLKVGDKLVPESMLAELRQERDSFAKHCDLLTHKVITCGVAARHPDAGLSKRGAYAGKWDSPQAQDVRDLRDAKDAVESKYTALLSRLGELADEFSATVQFANGLGYEWESGANHGRKDAAKRIRQLLADRTLTTTHTNEG